MYSQTVETNKSMIQIVQINYQYIFCANLIIFLYELLEFLGIF